MKKSSLTQKGQITVPKEFRDRFGWTQETELVLLPEEDGVKIVEVTKSSDAIIEKMKAAKWSGPSADDLMKETRSEC